MLSVARCQVRCISVVTKYPLESIGTGCSLGLVEISALPADLFEAKSVFDVHLTWRPLLVTMARSLLAP
ncbi:hypothetical protein GW17_00035306 [Ensete ventricosum]|nr:hypothetical protein GW17_00035306 [Ensete ventricosum]